MFRQAENPGLSATSHASDYETSIVKQMGAAFSSKIRKQLRFNDPIEIFFFLFAENPPSWRLRIHSIIPFMLVHLIIRLSVRLSISARLPFFSVTKLGFRRMAHWGMIIITLKGIKRSMWMKHNEKEIWMDDEIEKISKITQVERKAFILSWLSVSKMRFETIVETAVQKRKRFCRGRI